MLIDQYKRVVDYLRVSVTQRCNFRCQYCMPEKPFEWVPKEDLLSYEELFKIVKTAVDNGVRKIRITGGEPLVRKNLHEFIAMIHNYDKDVDIALTTNGVLLASQIDDLYKAGLKRLNISLDSLNRETFWYLSKKDALDSVKEGIEKALSYKMLIKLNTVVLQNINDTELYDLYKYTKQRGIQIRYIEYMENDNAYEQLKTVASKDILKSIQRYHSIKELPRKDCSAAKLYQDESGYPFGIIEPYDDSFCQSCNRIRLSAEGDIIPCLYFEDSKNIKAYLHDEKELEKVLKEAVWEKPEKNKWQFATQESDSCSSSRAFYYTGG